MSKFYFCKTIGDGTEDNPFTPKMSLYANDFVFTDARFNQTTNGWAMVECKSITQEQHDLAINHSDVIYFDVNGIGLDAKINKITDRTALISSLAYLCLDIDGLTSDNTLREILINISRQLVKRQNPTAINIKTNYDN